MGIYDSIYTKLKCSGTGRESEVEIQFKWAYPSLQIYRIGDKVFSGPPGNIWIEEFYVCEQCSECKLITADGKPIAKTPISTTCHSAFIHLDDGKIIAVLSEEEFNSKYKKGDEVHLPSEEELYCPDDTD